MAHGDDRITFTEAEIAALIALAAIEGINERELLALLIAREGFIPALEASAAELAETYFANTAATFSADLTGSALATATETARTAATARAKKVISGMAQSEIKSVGKIMVDGAKQGLTSGQINRQLELVRGLDSSRAGTLRNQITEWEKMGLSKAQIDRRALRLRQQLLQERLENRNATEQLNAEHQARNIEAKVTGKREKRWGTAGDARVDPACADNEADGWIPIDDSHSSGADQPLEHSKCRCDEEYR